MTRNVQKVLGKTAQLCNKRGNQNLFHAFAVDALGTTKPLSSNTNYSIKVKKENFINIPTQLHNNNKLMNIFAVDFKNYSSSSVISNNNSTLVLNPVQYKGWSKEEVCSLLCTPERNGGAGLTLEKVTPLYYAGFDGTFLANIVTNIQEEGKKEAIKQVKKTFQDADIRLTVELLNTLQTVVNWVDHLLKTRLYHLWSVDEVRELLCKAVNKGGAGLTRDKVQPLYEAGFDGSSLANITTDELCNEQTKKIIENWIVKQLKFIRAVEVDFNVGIKELFLEYKRRKEPYSLLTPILPIDFKKSEVMVQKLSDNFSILESATDKNNIFLPCLACAPGTGKSRTLQEIFKYTDQYKKYQDNHIEIRLSFGNGTGVTKEEKTIGEALCSRILYSYLDIDDLTTFKKKCEHFNLEIVIQSIVNDWRRNNNKTENTDVAVYLAIDEFTKIDGHSVLSLKSILEEVGKFIQMRNSKGKIKLFPIFAGLDSTFFSREITNSTYHSSYYSPYIYSDDDLIAIVNQYVAPQKQNATLWKAISLINYHPRMLEWLIDSYRVHGDAKRSYEHVNEIYSKHYSGKIKLTEEGVKKLIGYSITGHTINDKDTKIDGFTINQLQDNGYIRYDNNQITMSLPTIMLLISDVIFVEFFTLFKQYAFDQNSHHEKFFEQFNAYFEVVLNQSYIAIGKTIVTMEERFRGTEFSGEIGSKTIDLTTFPTVKGESKYLVFESKQKPFQIPASTLIHNTFSRSPFFDRFAKTMIEGEMWTILWQDRGTVSGYDCLTLPELVTIIRKHFTTEKLAVVGATKEKSLAIVVTTRPYAKTAKSYTKSCTENIGILGRDGLEKYYGNFIFRGYLLNIIKPFPINKPNKYTDYELALFFGILIGKAKTIRSQILTGQHVTSTSLPKLVGKSIELSSISFDVNDP